MAGMKRVIFSYVLLVSGLGTAENPSISYSEELWNQYTDSETVLVKKMDDTDKKISKLKSVNRNPKPGSGVVANWARQRTGKSTAELKKERTHLKELGKLVLESRNEVQAQQERMRTIQFVQSQTNELSPPLLEEALSRLTNQIGQLVKMEKTLMTKMGMPVQKNKEKKETRYNPLAMLPGCPLCQLAGTPNGLPGHTNAQNPVVLPDPNVFDSGLNP